MMCYGGDTRVRRSEALQPDPGLGEVAGSGVSLADPKIEPATVAPAHLRGVVRVQLQQQPPIVRPGGKLGGHGAAGGDSLTEKLAIQLHVVSLDGGWIAADLVHGLRGSQALERRLQSAALI